MKSGFYIEGCFLTGFLPSSYDLSFPLSTSFSPSLHPCFVVLVLLTDDDKKLPAVRKRAHNLLKTWNKTLESSLSFQVAESFLKKMKSLKTKSLLNSLAPEIPARVTAKGQPTNGHAIASPTAVWLGSSSHQEEGSISSPLSSGLAV